MQTVLKIESSSKSQWLTWVLESASYDIEEKEDGLYVTGSSDEMIHLSSLLTGQGFNHWIRVPGEGQLQPEGG